MMASPTRVRHGTIILKMHPMCACGHPNMNSHDGYVWIILLRSNQ